MMTLPISLVLVRHGESEGNVANRRSRRGDDSAFTEEFLLRHSSTWRLTDKGRKQADQAGAWIKGNIGVHFGRYYVSEHVRALETAAWLGLPKAEWYRSFYLRERDWGELDVLPHSGRITRFAEELKKRQSDYFNWAPPNGESIAEMCLRIDRMFQTMHRECEHKSVIIVCHGEVMWAFRILLERMTVPMFQRLITSADPHDRIHNAQILHYTRQNPKSGSRHDHLDWMRSVCPTDLSLSRNAWEPVVRTRFTNEDLLKEVELISPTVR